MTDGIIQEVFNQFRSERLGKSITHSETLTLENRLIERIKKEYERQYKYPMGITLKSLIGDSA